MTPAQLQKYMLETYFWLRVGLGALAFAFPLLLVVIGFSQGIPLQNALSDYYFAFAPPSSPLRVFPERVVFVGILSALGFFLLLYRGFSRTEGWLLNIAGLSAIVVALFPTAPPDYCHNCGSGASATVHFVAATILFVSIAIDAWACTDQTLGELPPIERRWFRWWYDFLALGMLVFPAAAVLLTYLLETPNKSIIAVEWAGIVTFAIYWGLKTYELSLSGAEKRALAGRLEPPPAATSLRRRIGTMLD